MKYHPLARFQPVAFTLVMLGLATAIVVPSGSVATAASSVPIEITKTADAQTVSAGDQIGFTITVTAPTKKDVSDVLITDTLPSNAGTSWSISPATAECAIASGVLQCSLKKLSGGSSFSVHIVSPTSSSTCGLVNNQASVTTKKSGSATSETAAIQVDCPDLIVQAITFSAPPNFPQPHSYTVTVKNEGNAIADLGGLHVQGYYSATEGSWPGSTAASGTSFNPGTTLAPGATIDIAVGNSAAPLPAENWLVVKVDSIDVLAESDETNNIGSAALPYTDLIVEAITFSAPPTFPQPHSYTVTVKNQGNATADLGGLHVQGFYSATEGSWPGSTAASGTSFNPGTTLAPGETIDIVVGNYAAPASGESWLMVMVDFLDVLAESDETNNIGSAALPHTDLIVQAITFSAPPNFPQPHSYTVTVKNQGNATADLGGLHVQGFYSATEGSWPGSTAASGTSFNPGTTLAPGATIDIVVGNHAAPAPGESWLMVMVDFLDVLAESDETNNIGSAALP